MSITDPIADFLTVVKNGIKAKKEKIDCPLSKIKEQIAGILKKEGFIKNFKKIEDNKQGILRVYPKYGSDKKRTPAITNIVKVSCPGRRVYRKSYDIKPVQGGVGIAIASTSKGLKTDEECRQEKIGGEIICIIW